MSLTDNEKFHIPRNVKIIDGFPGEEETEQRIKKLEERIKELELENKILKQKIEDLTKKVSELQQENQTLKEKLGIVNSEWQMENDLAWRDNPITGDPEYYNFPTFFDANNAKNLQFTDRTKYMYRFDYELSDGEIKEYKIPVSLYNHIKKYYGIPALDDLFMKMKKEAKQNTTRKTDLISINSLDDMKKTIEKFGEKSYDYNDFLSSVTEFVIGLKGKKFGTHDFKRENKIKSSTTVSKYLKMLEKCKIIEKEKMGNWKVIIG